MYKINWLKYLNKSLSNYFSIIPVGLISFHLQLRNPFNVFISYCSKAVMPKRVTTEIRI